METSRKKLERLRITWFCHPCRGLAVGKDQTHAGVCQHYSVQMDITQIAAMNSQNEAANKIYT